MTVSKDKLKSKLDRVIVLILLAFAMFSATMPMAYGQGAGGAAMSGIRNNNAASDIVGPYDKRYKNMAAFRREDQVVNQESVGPGQVIHSTSGPVQVWPVSIPTATSAVPTLRDQAITKNMFQTFGYPLSDTQFQLISRMNDNIATEQLYDPEKAHWMATATAGSASNAAANSMASLAINQALSAIDFCKQFLTNFTAEPNNVWQRIRDQLFVPMAILLLLPGAVLAQVKAIVAQGSPVLVGEIHPFEGLFRSIVAIFLIPGTFLVINYGIDVANSLTYTIANEYFHIFGTDMYEDAKCAIIRAFPMNKPEWNRNSFNVKETPRFEGTGNWAPLEGYTLATARIDPCMGVEESRVPDEDVVQSKNINRMMMNGLNDTATISWNLACAFQMAFLYYLWCMGPVAAALWVWPVQALRGALSSWIDGVITVCFWSLFWNTTILLMACFRGVGDSGTIIMTALIFLAVNSVKSAFDFAGLASAAVQDAAAQAQKVASSAKGGGAGGGSGGSSGGASQGSKAGSGNAGSSGNNVGGSGPGSGDKAGASVGATPSDRGSGSIGSTGGIDSGTSSPIGGADNKAGLGEGVAAANAGKAGGDNTRGLGAVGDVDMPPPAGGDGDAVGGSGSGSGSGGKGAGDAAGMPPLGDIGGAAAAAGGSIDSSVSVAHDFAGMPGGSADSLSVNTNNGGGGGGGGLASGADAAKGGMDSLLNSGAGGMLAGAAGAAAGNILGGNDAGVSGIPQALAGFDTAKADFLGDSKAAPINLDLNNPANSLGGNFAAPLDLAKSGMGGDVLGAPNANGVSDALLRDASGQVVTGADGRAQLDIGKAGEAPALSGNIASDPGAMSAQKTALEAMTMSGVTTDQLSRAMADPQGADYKSIADTVGVAPPILDAALHGNTSAGVMTAVGFGGTDTAASFASAPGIANDTASMSIAAHSQAQMIAGGDTGMLSRATVGMDSQAASQLMASPQMDAQFASTMGGYAQAREATGSYAQSDAQYASMSSFGGVAQGIAPNMISGDLSPAGSVAQANGFASPVAAVSNDPGAVSAHNAAADIMAITHTSGAELQRALSQPGSAEYTQLAERFGAAPALVDAALHGSAAAAAVVETGFGRTDFARDNAATSFTAHQSVEMYNAAATNYGAPAVQSAAMDMNVGAGQQILQSGQLDQQFANTVSSYRESSLGGSYAQADTGYVTASGSTPAVTASMVTGGADAPGALAASMGYAPSYSVGSDPGAHAAQGAAADIMAMTHTSPETLQRALSNPSGAEYAQLTQSFGSSPVLVDAALHGNASAAAIVETGFGHTQTAHQYADSSSTAQQSVAMYDTASTRYGEQTVQQATQGDIGSAQAILQSSQLDNQFASTVQSYQQAYSASANSGAAPSFANVDYGSVTPSGAQPVVSAALVGGDPSPVGSYGNAAGYSAPYALPSGDASAVTAQRMGTDIMAMTHTSPQELRSAIAHPESQQYQQLAERMGASPALVDSALHGNMSAAVVASAGFGTTETARQFEGQSVTAAQSMQYSERAQNAAIASGATNGADVVRQAAIGMDASAGQAILGSTPYANQFTSTVAAYQAEASTGRGYIDAPSVPNVIAGQGQGQDMSRGTASIDPGYSGGTVQPANYTAYSGDQSNYTQPNYTQPNAGYSGGSVVNDAAYNSGGQPQSQQQYTADAGSGYREVPQSQPNLSADSGYRDPVNLGSTGPNLGSIPSGEIASAAPWVGEVAPDTSGHGHAQEHAQSDAYYQQQQQQQQQQQGVVYGQEQQQARPNRLADALGGAAIAKIGGAGQKPAGGAPVARPEGGDKGAPPTQQVAVNKGLDPQAAKRTGKTKAQIEAELAEELRRQGQNMPGSDGMA
jgi:hypothetical protein